MISVIVPVYKVERYLYKCVQSILNQTYSDLEIILVDDGSPDNCGKICDELAKKDNRIIVIHQQNKGLSNARNAGLDICKGEFIGFVDGDDTIEPEMYQMLLFNMESTCDLAICGHRIIEEDEKLDAPKRDITYKLNNDELWEEVFGNLNNAVWNKLYRRDLIGNLRFLQGLLHGEDLLFNLQYLTKCTRGKINRTQFYNYLKRKNSITTSQFNENKLMEIQSKDLAKRIVEKYKPEQIKNANKFCFRARMNILRAIYAAHNEEVYAKIVNSCSTYIQNNYKIVKKNLKKRERVEFILFQYSKFLYIVLIRSII